MQPRRIQRALHFLVGHREHRRFIEMIENRFGMKVNISASEKFHVEQYQIEIS